MNDIILHHYPASPVSEKVRLALGIKKLAWRSVEIPRVLPKPDVMPLTGGYRRTPVMQIGADIYCDSQCILRELECRIPQPTLFPGGNEGMSWAIGRWTDALFESAAKILIGANADQLPPAFLNDRGPLFFGPDWNVEDIKRDLPHAVTQMRAQIGWVNAQLNGGQDFLFGSKPGLADTMAYYLVWFVRGRWQGGPAMLARLPAVEAWEKRVAAIGHGSPTEMTSTQAIEVALANQTNTPAQIDPNDPLGLTPGQKVGVKPDLNSGEVMVEGAVRYLSPDVIAIVRDDPRVGEVCVHFPRVGYRVNIL